LHNDYHILNSYISKKYEMPDYLELPTEFESELLSEVTQFDIEKLISDYQNDIVEVSDEKTVLLTEDMLEEFVAEYIDVLVDELRSIRTGRSRLNVLDYRWENKKE